MVKRVVGLEAELRSHVISEGPVLIQGGVPVLIAWAAKIREVTRGIAESVATVGGKLRESECSGIEPLVDIWMRGVNITDHIGPWIAAKGSNIVARDADWNPGFEGYYAR